MNKRRYPLMQMGRPHTAKTVYGTDKKPLSRKEKLRILRAKYSRMYAAEHTWSYPERIAGFRITRKIFPS